MWELDYDGALLLRMSKEATDALQNSSFYKLSLRRYVREVNPGFVRFKPADKIIHITDKGFGHHFCPDPFSNQKNRAYKRKGLKEPPHKKTYA